MVLFVRHDLKMGKGKIGAQCSHAMLKLVKQNIKDKSIKQFLSKKPHDRLVSVFKASSQEDLFNLKQEYDQVPHCVIRDAGRTQIAKGTYTVLGVFLTV